MCILLKGRPQKELRNGVVKLPFGAEYVLRLRNKNTRRALVKIFIDGDNVSGGGYIIDANDSVDIKRHHDKDRAFKFVPLDSGEAVEFGKDGPNDDKQKGTIEARFYFEKEIPDYIINQPKIEHHHHHYSKPSPFWHVCRPLSGGYNTTLGTTGDGNVYNCANLRSKSAPEKYSGAEMEHFEGIRLSDCSTGHESVSFNTPLKDGCTVEGNSTGQNFRTVYFDAEDTYTAITLFLQGHGEYESEYEEDVPVTINKTNKDKRLQDLEEENEKLRLQLAEIENQKLKEQLAQKKPKPRKRTSK